MFKRKATRRPYRRRTYRKRARTTARIPRSMPAVKNNLVSITRQYVATPISTTYALGWSYWNYTFPLSALQGYTEFTNLFGKYRINAVKLTFMPFFSGNDYAQAANSTVYAENPRVHYIVDTSGTSASQVDTEAEMLEFANVRTVRNPTKSFSIYIRNPCVHLGTASGVTIVGGAPKAKQWIDTANYNIVHHGCSIGMVIPGGASTGAWKFQVVIKYYMQFKEAQ